MSYTTKVATYDTEMFKNMFLFVAKDWTTKEMFRFEVSHRRNDTLELVSFLKTVERLIGFNNLSYDWPLVDWWMKNHKHYDEVGTLLLAMKHFSDKLISNENPKWNRLWNPTIEQVDLFSIKHYDNHARSTSLKKLQISMDWWNVEDSSEDFDEYVEDFDSVVHYCDNDVNSTDHFGGLCLKDIRERQNIRNKESIDCLNYSDSKLGEQLILKEYCEQEMVSIEELQATKRKVNEIHLKDIILPMISFDTPQFQNILTDLKTKTIRDGENIGFSFVFDEMPIVIAEGGIHGTKKGGFYSDELWILKDGDVSSEYPAYMAEHGVIPAHLTNTFAQIIKKHYQNRLLIKERLKAPGLEAELKKQLDYESERLKKSINSAYGKMGDKFSPLYGNDCIYKVTINCQLLVLKWMELLKEVPSLSMIQVNTDGIVVRMLRSDEEHYDLQCAKFMKLTNFLLEFGNYDRLCIRDVNNYCAITDTGKIKTKGEFVYEVKEDYHKRISFQVSRKAAVMFLLKDESMIEHIANEKNIFKFTGSVRFKKHKKTKFNFDNEDQDETGFQVKLDGSKGVLYDNQGNYRELPPNVRFIYSRRGGIMRKIFDDGRTSVLFENQPIVLTNKVIPNETQVLLDQLNVLQYQRMARKMVLSIEVPKIKKHKAPVVKKAPPSVKKRKHGDYNNQTNMF